TMAMNPSSIGLSFMVEPGVEDVEVTATWGRYVKETAGPEDVGDQGPGRADGAGDGGVTPPPEELDRPPGTGPGLGHGAGGGARARRPRQVWRRQPYELTSTLDLRTGGGVVGELGGASVEAVVRRVDDNGTAVSLFLVNRTHTQTPDRPDDEEWMFQPTLAVRSPAGAAVFGARRPDQARLADDRDMRSNELLYLSRPEFAAGHGCAATWDEPPGDPTGPTTGVAAEIVPAYEIPRVDPREGDDPGLDMWALGGTGAGGVSGPRLRELLAPLADGYADWLDG